MNATDQLRAIVQERIGGPVFGWGPILGAWALVLAARTGVEVVTGPRAELGALACLLILGFQVLSPWGLVSRAGRSRAIYQGLWSLLALTGLVFGSFAPSAGLLSAVAGAVLELLFVAGGLVQTGIHSRRRLVEGCGWALLGFGVLLAILPFLLAVRPLVLVLALGIPALWAETSRSLPRT